MNIQEKPRLPVGMGGTVMAVVPRSIEEIWRVSKMVVVGGLAPQSLVGYGDKAKTGDDAVSAVSIAIMFGAELGLPPMAALRSMAVINGRPALYGDGLVSVVRRSGRAEYIRMGFDASKNAGYCEARRIDTGEELRVEFSEADARQAGLWSDQAKVKRNGRNGSYETDNDSSWYRHPKRMMQWRATGFCLRNLFADVLAGVLTDDEAREASGQYADFEEVDTAANAVAAPSGPPSPPPAPEPEPDPAPEPEEADNSEPDAETPEELFQRATEWAENVNDAEDLDTYLDEFGQYLDGLGDDDRAHLQSILDRVSDRIEPNLLAAG
jgi:hypothetical protein